MASEYQSTAFTAPNSIAKRFFAQGFDVYASSTLPIFNHMSLHSQGMLGFQGRPVRFSFKLYGLMFVRFAPYAVKNLIANRVGWEVKDIGMFMPSGNLAAVPHYYSLNRDETAYLALMQAMQARSASRPTLQFHHTGGAHLPYIIDSKGNPLPQSERDSLYGLREQSKWTWIYVLKLLQRMKEEGIYDSTTIALLGDHGDRLYDDKTRLNPEYALHAALLIKPAGSRGRLAISAAPTSNMYVAPFLYSMKFKGKTLAELTENLPTRRPAFSGKGELITYEGIDVRSLNWDDRRNVDVATEPPTVMTNAAWYSFSTIEAQHPIAYPLAMQGVDMVNGWGLRAQKPRFTIELLVDAKLGDTMSADMVWGTFWSGGGSVVGFDSYDVTVLDAVSGSRQTVSIGEHMQNIRLDRLTVSENSSLRLDMSFELDDPKMQFAIKDMKVTRTTGN